MSEPWEIRTGRLLLRCWRDSDREPFAALNADPDVMRYFPERLDRTASDRLVDRFQRRFDERGYGIWALELLSTGTFIGFTGLNPLPEGVPDAGAEEVGWRLAREAWHHGYATEAATAVLALAFGPLRLSVVRSMTAILNTPSQALMRRLGMTRYQEFDHPGIAVGHPLRPHVVYGIDADSWRTRSLREPAAPLILHRRAGRGSA